VALAFEIPQTMLEDAANFATAKEHRLSFYEETIKPRANMIADVINQQLLAKEGLKMAFDFEELSIFQEDEADRAASLKQLTDAGVPLKLAMDILGYELDEEQLAMLNEEAQRKEQAAEEARQRLANAQQPPQAQEDDNEMDQEMRRWLRKALKRVKDGKPAACEFTSDIISDELAAGIKAELETCDTPESVKAVFAKYEGEKVSGLDSLAAELKRANDLLESASVEVKAEPVPASNPVTVNVNATITPAGVTIEPIPAPEVVVNVPEQPAPVVNVAVPEQPAPVVNITTPAQPAPVVNVSVDPTPVTIENSVNVPNVQSATVIRDKFGRVVGLEAI
jgi:hypothetical protein